MILWLSLNFGLPCSSIPLSCQTWRWHKRTLIIWQLLCRLLANRQLLADPVPVHKLLFQGLTGNPVRACRDQHVWDKVFAPLAQPPWDYDVHSHWQYCHDGLMSQLRIHFPKKRSHPRKPYISDEVWQLRNKRKALRRQAVLRAHLCPRLDFLVPFQIWRQQLPLRRAWLNGFLWVFRCHAAHLRAKPAYKDTQSQLKLALKGQRQEYIEQIAAEADLAPPQEIYKKLRAVGFSSARKSRGRPLPFVLQADGKPAPDIEALRQVWRAHFAAIECGHEPPAQELLQL